MSDKNFSTEHIKCYKCNVDIELITNNKCFSKPTTEDTIYVCVKCVNKQRQIGETK